MDVSNSYMSLYQEVPQVSNARPGASLGIVQYGFEMWDVRPVVARDPRASWSMEMGKKK